MTGKEILFAMEHVNEEHILRAAPTGKIARRVYMRWAAMAACLCLCIGTVLTLFLWQGETELDDGLTVSENGVTIPQMKVNLSSSDGAAADMIAFFIYGGRSYVAYKWIKGTDVVGEYLGTAVGLIDEWTSKDGYVELGGSIGGDFYTVNGYDSSFMLCMPEENDVLLFVNNNDMTLKTGDDLYGQRLHLADRYVSVSAESRLSGDYNETRVFEIGDEDSETLKNFVDALYAAPFMPREEIPLEKGDESIYDREIYHVFFVTTEGIPIHLRLYEGGYVIFQKLFTVCVKVDTEAFDAMVAVLDQHSSTEQ